MTGNSLKSICAPNFACDGEHCIDPLGEVHIIPIDRSNNVHLCRDCFEHELRYNEQLELEGKDRIIPPLPFDTYPTYLGE